MRHVPWEKRQKAPVQDDAILCAKTGEPISIAPPPNVIEFRTIVNSDVLERKNDPAQIIYNDDI